jgi:hypothetical protein
MEVVEHDDRGPCRGDGGEGAAQRLVQGRAIRARGRIAELGQQQRQLRAQATASVEPARPQLQVAAQHRGERSVRRRGALHGRAAKGRDPARGRELREQPGLAHPGLAAQEQEGALTAPGAVQVAGQHGVLRLPADERCPHRPSLSRR